MLKNETMEEARDYKTPSDHVPVSIEIDCNGVS